MRRVLLLAVTATIGLPASAGAATIPVTSNTDDGAGCTLREAIASADANADQGGCSAAGDYGDDVIEFASGSGAQTIPLTAELVVNPTQPGTLLIDGTDDPEITVSGQDARRVMTVTPNANSEANAVTISGLEVRDGFLGAHDPVSDEAVGAGILNKGRLTLDRVEVRDNSVDVARTDTDFFTAVGGGGIANDGTLTVTRSTIADNSVAGSMVSGVGPAVADAQGGGIMSGSSTVIVRHSTVSGNSASATATAAGFANASGGGGGISVISPLSGATNLTLEGSTVVGNSVVVTQNAGVISGTGGGVFLFGQNNPASATIANSTLAANTVSGTGGANLHRGTSTTITMRSTALAEGGGANCNTAVGSPAGHNLSDDGSCTLSQTGDLNNTPANLQALADNGGPTLTRRPAPPDGVTPSPLIDAGIAAGETEDQRALPRTVDYDIANATGGDGTDIGAVEVQGATPTATNPASPNADTTPEVSGTAEPGTTVQLYGDTTCTSPVGSPVSPETFASPGLTATLATNSSTSFRARAAYGTATSLCSPTGVTYLVPPIAPTLSSTDPSSPADENNPRIMGTADPGTTVTLYTAPDCAGAAAGTGSDTDLAGTGIQVSVPDNSSTTFYARATGAGGASGCSAGITYVALPAAPQLTATDPASPADDNTPLIQGSADAGTTVNLYTAADCSGTLVGTGSDSDLAGAGIEVGVPDNSTTIFYAQAVGAGGTSGCSTGISYTESTPAPTDQPPILTPTPPPTITPALEPKLKKKCKKKAKKKSKPRAAAVAAKKCKRKGKKKK